MKIKTQWSQWIVAIEIFWISTTMGGVLGWIVPILPKLLSPTSSVPVDNKDISMILTAPNIGLIIGAIIAAIISTKCGTKTSLIITSIIESIGLIFLIFTSSVNILITSRFVTGCSYGMLNVVMPMFIGEISNPLYRGAFSAIRTMGNNIGQVTGNVLGDKLDFDEFAYVMNVFVGIFLLSFYWLPQSPYYFIYNNNDHKAHAAIEFYRPDIDASTEILSLKTFIKKKKTMSFMDIYHEFMIPHNRLGLFKIIVLIFLQQMSGPTTVNQYTGIILENVEYKSLIIPLITGSGFVGSLLSILTSHIFGRKILLCFSSIMVTISLSVLGSYYILLENNMFDENLLNYMLVGSLLFRKLFTTYGISPIVYAILSEIFPPNIKFLSISIVTIISGLLSSLSVLLYQPLLDTIGYNIYFFYAFLTMLLFFFTIIFLSETNGKTLEEIQIMIETKHANK